MFPLNLPNALTLLRILAVPVVVVADPESPVRCSTNTVVVTTAATTRNAAPAINHPRRADPERCDGGYEGCPGGGAYGPTGGT